MRDWLIVAVIAAGVVVLLVIGVRTVMRGRHVPNKAKLAIIGALVWLLSPVDPLPDVVPVAGLLDDLAVLVAVVHYVMDQIQPSEPSASRSEAAGDKPGALGQRLNQRDALKPSSWRLSDNGQPPDAL